MIYDLSNIDDSLRATLAYNKHLKSNDFIEIKKVSKSRSLQQNKALHKFFTIVADQLNEMGMEFTYNGIKGKEISTRYNAHIIKNFLWRPLQIALFDIESTTKINTTQMNEIIDVISKYFAERGVSIEFPSIETLINKR